MADHRDYAILVFGLAILGFPLWQLSSVNSSLAYIAIAVLCFVATLAVTMFVIHRWRHH